MADCVKQTLFEAVTVIEISTFRELSKSAHFLHRMVKESVLPERGQTCALSLFRRVRF